MASDRSVERVASWIHKKVATILVRDMRDPRIGFITITRVVVSRDLETCAIHYSVLGDDKKRKLAARALEHASAFIQREIGSGLRTRVIPRVHFEYDKSIDAGLKMSGLLGKIAKEREEREGSPGDPGQKPDSENL